MTVALALVDALNLLGMLEDKGFFVVRQNLHLAMCVLSQEYPAAAQAQLPRFEQEKQA